MIYLYKFFLTISFAHFSDCLHSFRIPNYEVSYNTLRFNSSDRFGYVTAKKIVKGILEIVTSEKELESLIAESSAKKIILLITQNIFTKKNLLTLILDSRRIVGILVISDTISRISQKNDVFSELPDCQDFNYMTCFTEGSNIYSHGYYYHKWKIPVILLKNKGKAYDVLRYCHSKFKNVEASTRNCMVLISNYLHKIMTYDRCMELQNSWRSYFFLTHRFEYCKVYGGNNIYMTFTDGPLYNPRSVILIYTKLDSLSMFDTAAAGVSELYPTIAAMFHMAQIFTEASNNNEIEDKSDILLAFVDNNDVDQMGAGKLYYDLKEKRVSNLRINISDANIKLIVYIGEIHNWRPTLTFITNKCQYDKLCGVLKQNLKVYGEKYHITVYNYDLEDGPDNLKLWTSFEVPIIEMTTNLISKNRYKSSYLDIYLTRHTKFLENVSNTIAMSLIKTLKSDQGQKVELDLRKIKIKPTQFARCLQNLSCEEFSNYIDLDEMWMYENFANPFISQSFVDEIMTIKGVPIPNRLSTFIIKVLVVYFNKGKSPMTKCLPFRQIKYLETKINGKLFCFETRIQVENNFDPSQFSRSKEQSSIFPKWMHISLYKTQVVKVYVSHCQRTSNTLVVIYTIFTALCLIGSLFLYRNLDLFLLKEDI